MKKVIGLLTAAAVLCLTACSINSQGFYGKDEAPAPFVKEQGIIAEHAAPTEFNNCATFTDMLNQKFAFARGYTNTQLDGTDVLLLSDGLFEMGDGTGAAVNTEVYCYKDGAPYYLGYVKCGGSANPLAEKDGKLYAAGHHYIGKITVTDNELVTVEEAWQTFDKKGNATYHYNSDDGGDYSSLVSEEAEKLFDALFNEYVEAETVKFNIVGAPYSGSFQEIFVDYGNSAIYSEADMDEATGLIFETIGKWDGCELHSVRYAGDDKVTEENLRWMKQLGHGKDYADVISFQTDFHSPVEGGGAWEPDKEYEDYEWWLARTEGGSWELLTWGY